ncbi:MAG TPA: RIP metalloprotease RseP [Bacteroidales bacterium]|nr:RIP metalloprotease RseP [Bacteroidales bacterium]HPS16692.1 RIP metalloprotease RseP [Bacteroidales bacterium]
MEVFIKIVQLVLSLSIMVIIHELGHFIPAKLFKTKVEKFFLFFDVKFSIVKFRKIDGKWKAWFFKKNNDTSIPETDKTELGVGWLPLGGYVKIAGMIDESMDKEQMKLPPQPWEFRSKKTWQRLIVMVGGVTMNVVLAIAIYIVMLSLWGEEYLPAKNVKYGIACDSMALEMGLRNGDKILSVENKEVKDFFKIPAEIILEEAKTIQVIRDGKKMDVEIPYGFSGKLSQHKSPDFITVRFPYEVEEFAKTSPAKDAGMMVNDRIIGLNEKNLEYYNDFRTEIVKHKNESVNVTVLRNKDTLHLPVNVPEDGKIGVQAKSMTSYFELNKQEYNFFQAIPAGTVKAYEMMEKYLKSLKLIFSPETKAYESLGGFISIGNIFPAEWDWSAFWNLTAFLSIMLAVMNLLPIPALDGGYVLFLLYEIIFRRKPSEKFMEYATYVGMFFLLALLVLANGNDIIKLFK